MTTPTHSQPSETAKATLAFLVGDEMFYGAPMKGQRSVPYVHIKCATRKQAQQIVKWANLSREQKVEAIAKALNKESAKRGQAACSWIVRQPEATAILNLIEGATK